MMKEKANDAPLSKELDTRGNKDGTGINHTYEPKTFNGDKVIIDHATGLTWQQTGSGHQITYTGVEPILKNCALINLLVTTIGGLPTLEEAMSLMEPRKSASNHVQAVVVDVKERKVTNAPEAKI